ncbi:hypothetical protein [Paenibacillus sp. YYML68]|uniref:hypothetical protein n=1 Tax=Paenibacillus sp. YYML68 TaxID=2909250 RepID=UPI002490C451|nr:hypothetical protein [Paenibacillus sp. YYML68]
MRQRNNMFAYIIFALIAIGVLASLLSKPGAFLIPLLIFGGIFLLYKYPPHTWKQLSRRSGTMNSRGAKSKRATFRVIPGNKRSSDSEEPPKYH